MYLFKRNHLIGLLLICLIALATFSIIGDVSANDLANIDSNDDSEVLYDGLSNSIDSNNDLDDFNTDFSDESKGSASNYDANVEESLREPSFNDENPLQDSNEHVFYVSQNGSDSNSGLSEDEAYLTINKTLENIYSNNLVQTQIYLSEGTFYDELIFDSIGNVIITGAGINKTILDGENVHRIAKINNTSVTFKDISFINGFDPILGGAIYNEGNLTLINCSFRENKVFSGNFSNHTPSVYGGAIYNAANLSIENSIFENNSLGSIFTDLAFGGSIYNSGLLSINNSIFSNVNITTHMSWDTYSNVYDAFQKGGQIYSFSDNLLITNSKFLNNDLKGMKIYPSSSHPNFHSYTAGAAVYLEGNNAQFLNCDFINNSADSGGAIWFEGNNTQFDACNFINNSAFRGAALMILDYNSIFNINLTKNKNSNLTIINSVFENNGMINSTMERIYFLDYYGAGAGFLKIDDIFIFNSSFINNGLVEGYTSYYNHTDAFCHSGALFLCGQNSVVENSTFISNRGEIGGAIYNYGFDTKIIDASFINNSACLLDGGAIFHSIGDLLVDNCYFDSNNATRNGGTIQASYDFTNNYLFNQKSIYNNSVFYNSNAEYGGAIFDTGNSIIFENLAFINNSASYGGAIYKQGFSNTFRNISFVNNSASLKDFSDGGAIYNYGSNVIVESCNFTNNSADLEGGAIYNFGESSLIINNTFDLNKAFKGGSLYLTGSGGRFQDNSISSSFANYGGGIYNVNLNLICLNNDFNDCSANVTGGAIYNLVSTLQLYNNSMNGCKANLSGLGCGNYIFTSGNISYLVVSFSNDASFTIVDNNSVVLTVSVSDNMGNPITGGQFSFTLFNQSDDSGNENTESTLIGVADVIEGFANLKVNLILELGCSYVISGTYSYGAEPISTQMGSLNSILSSKMYFDSNLFDNKLVHGENLTYELILLDSLNNYISNAEILVFLDGTYCKSVFTDDVGYLNDAISNIALIGKHHFSFIYEGDVFHNRLVKDLDFDVFYNNTYIYDGICLSFTDLAFSIISTDPNREINYQFVLSHMGGEGLDQVSTHRYFLVYENGHLLDLSEYRDYLGDGIGVDCLYNIISVNGHETIVYLTDQGSFLMPLSKDQSGLYEYTISFIGDLVKHYDTSMHNHVSEEDTYYNPCNISFILIVENENADISTNLNYTAPETVTEVDYPYYTFNLTDSNTNPLTGREIRIYDNGSYVGSAFTDYEGLANFKFQNMLDIGYHLIEFVFVGDEEYLSSYKILELDVLENPRKDNVYFANKSSLNLTGPNNNFTAQLKDYYGNNLSNFTVGIELLFTPSDLDTYAFAGFDKNTYSLLDGTNTYSKNITVLTDENGLFTIPLELGGGNYTINCHYGGNKYYWTQNSTFNLNVSRVGTLLFGQSSIEVLKNETYLTVILSTEDLNVLSNYKIKYLVLNDDNDLSINISSLGNCTVSQLCSYICNLSNYYTSFYAFTNGSSISKLKISLPVGKYVLFTVFEGDKWYDASSLVTNLSVYGEKSKLEANENIIIKESGYYSVKLLASNGNPIAGESIEITVNCKSYTRMTDANGEARLEINLAYGNYTITSKFKGTINYTSSAVSSNLYVVDKNYKYPSFLKVNSSLIYRGTGYYELILSGINNERLIHKNIIVNVNGTNYTIRTNNDGVAHLDYDFTIGSYSLNAFFAGDNEYQSSSISSILTVVSENAANTVMNSSVYCVLKGKGGVYTVTLSDKLGNPIAGQMIYFTINNKEYSNKTDNNGNANLAITLNPGSYNVDSIFRGNDVYFASSTFSKLVVLPDDEGNGSNVMDNNQNTTVNNGSSAITKLSTKIVASNLVKYYKDSKKLVITLKDSKNKIVAGRSLSIRLNGKTYKGGTDKKGQIKITVNLKKGSYSVSIKFAGDKYYKASSKKVTVKVVYPQIKAVKTTVKRNKKLQVKFLTYKGKAIKSQKVTFKIKGKTYTVKTNSKGIASLKIKVKKGTYGVKLGFKNTKTYGKYTKTIKIKVK